MIRFGFDDCAKTEVVDRYIAEHGITKVFVISPKRFAPSFAPVAVTQPDDVGRSGVYIPWPEHIEYRYYYRVIQTADASSLLVLNEVLRGQHRKALNFNCIRTFLRHVRHKIVFQYLPIIDSLDDVMTLIDFETDSRWWDRSFAREMLADLDLRIDYTPLEIAPLPVAVDARTQAAYTKEKASLLSAVRDDPEKDPHLIPRNLLLVSGKAKAPSVAPDKRYVGRNNRFRLDNMETFREASEPGERIVFEPPHNFIDMTDFLTVSRQHRLPVLVADTKADAWYLQRYQDWARRVNDAAVALHR